MTSGIDTEYVDETVRIQDDLFRHVNGRWLDTAPIAEDRAVAGAFVNLRDDAEKAVREIIEDAAGADAAEGSEQRKIGDLYASFMDEAHREELGQAPMQPALAAVDAVTDVAGLVSLVGQSSRAGVSGMFALYVINDAGDPTRYVVHLYQGGLGLPDESYYREDKFGDVVAAYEKHVTRMLELAEVDNAQARAASVLGLERDLASSPAGTRRRRTTCSTASASTRSSRTGRSGSVVSAPPRTRSPRPWSCSRPSSRRWARS